MHAHITLAARLLVLIGVLLMAGCGVPAPTPTPMPPTPTPETPLGRVDAYYDALHTQMALLRRYNLYMVEAAAKEDKPAFWFEEPRIYLSMRIIDELPVPSPEDLAAVGMTPTDTQVTLQEAHNDLLNWLQPCRDVGSIGMLIEDYSTQDLMAAHEECNQVLAKLEERWPALFVCPEGEPLCAIANRE